MKKHIINVFNFGIEVVDLGTRIYTRNWDVFVQAATGIVSASDPQAVVVETDVVPPPRQPPEERVHLAPVARELAAGLQQLTKRLVFRKLLSTHDNIHKHQLISIPQPR